MIRYEFFPCANANISKLAVGTWPMGNAGYGPFDEKDAIAAIHTMFDQGVNIIDTAPDYGTGFSDLVVGKALKSVDRSKIFVATKVGSGGCAMRAIRTESTFERNDPRSFFYPFYREPNFSQVMKLLGVLDKVAAEVGKPVVQVAINWQTQQGYVSTALNGVRTPAEALENSGAFDWELNPEQLAAIDAAIEEYIDFDGTNGRKLSEKVSPGKQSKNRGSCAAASSVFQIREGTDFPLPFAVLPDDYLPK